MTVYLRLKTWIQRFHIFHLVPEISGVILGCALVMEQSEFQQITWIGVGQTILGIYHLIGAKLGGYQGWGGGGREGCPGI